MAYQNENLFLIHENSAVGFECLSIAIVICENSKSRLLQSFNSLISSVSLLLGHPQGYLAGPSHMVFIYFKGFTSTVGNSILEVRKTDFLKTGDANYTMQIFTRFMAFSLDIINWNRK